MLFEPALRPCSRGRRADEPLAADIGAAPVCGHQGFAKSCAILATVSDR
jgi:hypothetical protein